MKQLELGRQLRDAGIARVEDNGKVWVAEARRWAITQAKFFGSVSINNVRASYTLPHGLHPNTWSAVLKCKELVPIGYTQATHKEAHARMVRVYEVRK